MKSFVIVLSLLVMVVLTATTLAQDANIETTCRDTNIGLEINFSAENGSWESACHGSNMEEYVLLRAGDRIPSGLYESPYQGVRVQILPTFVYGGELRERLETDFSPFEGESRPCSKTIFLPFNGEGLFPGFTQFIQVNLFVADQTQCAFVRSTWEGGYSFDLEGMNLEILIDN